MKSIYEQYPQYKEFKIWDEFLKTWPLKRVEEMTLDEYTNLNREDSFTYWIESRTKKIISIKGGSSYKFGIFLRNVEAETLKNNQATDGKYGWYKKYGDSAEEAFGNIKKLVIEVIINSIKKEFSNIDPIDLGHSYKWKIAFMYAEPGTLPGIVSRKAIEFLAKNNNCSSTSETSNILKCLIQNKPNDQDFWKYTRELWNFWKSFGDNNELTTQPNETANNNKTNFSHHNDLLNETNAKNIILYGIPGVGKTHNIKKLISLIESKQSTHKIFQILKTNEKSNVELSEGLQNRVKFVTFHQSFGYEDFIEGFRPDENGNIEIQEGIFKRICQEASENPEQNHYLVIDEINRGNISKIFGELITLIEEDKRDKLEVTLPYSKKPFKVPSNLYIIGTMNTADKSIAMIDVALRRRFTFVKMEPKADLIEHAKARKIFEELNQSLAKRLDNDHLIGHSYFMGIESDDDLQFVLDYKIELLLEEYFYGDKEGLEEAKKKCTISRESGSETSDI